MKKAVIYARFSSEKQNEMSIEGQVRVCSEYAARNGYEIVGKYIDRAVSGTTDQRQEFQAMIHDSAAAEWTAVIVYKLDRFSRNRTESALNRYTLKKNGVVLLSAQENIPETPEGVILESLIEGLNEYYSLELAQKVSRSFYDRRKRGQFLGGRAPYGYTVKDKQYVIDELAAKDVRCLFDEIEKGRMLRDVAHDLAEKDFNVYWAVRNIKYAGCLVHNGEIIENVIPAIITREQFDRVQILLNQNQTCAYRPSYNYPLSGKIFCGECGSKMTGGCAKSGAYRYYNCKTPHHTGRCSLPVVDANKLENEIVQKVCEIVSAPKKRAAIVNAVVVLLKENANSDTVKLIKTAYNKAKRRRDNTVNAIAEIGANAALQAKLNELENEMQSLLGELERAKKSSITKEKVERKLLDILSAPTDKLKVRILKDLVVRVVCYKDHNEVFFTTTQPPLPPSNSSESSNNVLFGDPHIELSELQVTVYLGFFSIRLKK